MHHHQQQTDWQTDRGQQKFRVTGMTLQKVLWINQNCVLNYCLCYAGVSLKIKNWWQKGRCKTSIYARCRAYLLLRCIRWSCFFIQFLASNSHMGHCFTPCQCLAFHIRSNPLDTSTIIIFPVCWGINKNFWNKFQRRKKLKKNSKNKMWGSTFL